ncbi:MAG TPA: MBL fold metallo-hydrolase [Armatimonadota bacterium]|jgi:competence protein ComEC
MKHHSWSRGLLVLVGLVGFLRLVVAAPLVVSVINVGQGDSILVQFPDGKDMLVDAGDSGHGTAVVSYLRSRAIKRIDILVASHPHADHIGGMPAVFAALPVGKVWDSGYNQGSRTQQQFLQTIRQKHIAFGTPRAGFSQSVGGVRIDVLAPGKTLLTGTDSDANNNSLVLRLAYGATSVLLPGDMEEAERATVSDWPSTTVLKVAHHGSRNGTDLSFARALAPEIAVISYGEGNEYEHPHPEAVTALREVGATIYRTATQGTIVLTSNGSQVTAKALGVARTAATADSCAYIGNRRTHIYHLPTANHLPKPENRVCFASRAEAERAGYRPCKLCFR